MHQMPTRRRVFIAGGTGYMGGRLIPLLLSRGHEVTALARAGSERKLDQGCKIVVGDALNPVSYQDQVAPGQTFVHMIGVAHPSPAKAREFRSIDLPAALASLQAAVHSQAEHFVYVSVAHPAPVMKAYIETRMEAEAQIRASSLNATFLRPWYVLGPGHRWAHALRPIYWLCEKLPPTRAGAMRLGLVTLPQMTQALAHAVENPADGIRIVEPPEIRASLPR